MGAIVTAFGTGAEMNCGAVITHEEKKLKNGVMGAYYDFAILDPEYTMSMPLKQVISGAFDSLSHSMETYMGSPREVNYSDEINEAIPCCFEFDSCPFDFPSGKKVMYVCWYCHIVLTFLMILLNPVDLYSSHFL